jgi:putative ABC transport system permease protein
MSVIKRGVKNAFRNGLRTSAVVLILALSIGLSLSMLVANKAVEGRIADLKTEVSTTISVNPAGSRGSEGGGEPLTDDDLQAIAKLDHVDSANGFMNFTLQTEGDTGNMRVMMGGSGVEPGETNLESSIEPGTLGQRFNASDESGNNVPADIKLPIRGIGFNGSVTSEGKAINITSGRLLEDDDTYSAIVGKGLAEKNDLKVGSTFTAYDKTFTVVGIADQGNQFENDGVMIPLKTAQELTGLSDEVSPIVVDVDSIDNLESVISSIKKALGEDSVDVTSSQENVRQAIESLKSVQKVSIVGFIASLAAAAMIVLMVMFVIVRERRREIGVLKAIGGSNRTIVAQFVVEAIVLVAVGGIIGLGTAAVGSGAIANALVSSNTSSGTEDSDTATGPMGGTSSSVGPRVGGPSVRFDGSGDTVDDTKELVGKVATNIGWSTLAYGLAGMIVIAIVGSAIPAWLIAKVRPAEVLRGE